MRARSAGAAFCEAERSRFCNGDFKMKVLDYSQFILCAHSPRRTRGAAVKAMLRRAWTRVRRAWRGYRARSRRRCEDISLLDHRVLEEIGLTREQVTYDACQTVWWR
jgi:hypothetical protein